MFVLLNEDIDPSISIWAHLDLNCEVQALYTLATLPICFRQMGLLTPSQLTSWKPQMMQVIMWPQGRKTESIMLSKRTLHFCSFSRISPSFNILLAATQSLNPYLIFVISFTRAGFSKTKFYTKTLKISLKKVCSFSPNLKKFTPDRKFLHRHVCGVCDKYEVCFAGSFAHFANFIDYPVQSLDSPLLFHFLHVHQ